MSFRAFIFFLFLSFLTLLCILPSALLGRHGITQLPDDFQERVFAHVERLSTFGIRYPGTSAAAETVTYLREQFAGVGLSVEEEPFEFHTFVLGQAELTVGIDTVSPRKVVLTTFQGSQEISGEVVVFDPANPLEDFRRRNVSRSIVLTMAPASHVRLAHLVDPAAIVYLSAEDFLALRTVEGQSAFLSIEGKVTSTSSRNVVAILPGGSGSTQQLLVSAALHLRLPQILWGHPVRTGGFEVSSCWTRQGMKGSES